MENGNRSPNVPSGWLEALHEAVTAGHDGQFNHPEAETVAESHVDAVRECLRLLEKARRCRESVNGDPTGTVSENVAASDLPKHVGRFRIVRELGRGGFGIVFLAFDPRIGRNVALKIPRPEVLAAPSTRRRFLREAEAAGALEHPNVIPIYDVGEQGVVCYIASAYCAGPNLAQWLADRSEPAPIRSAAQFVRTLAHGVDHAHRRGVLHRDIKPANVLLEPIGDQPSDASLSSWIPRLTDFGLAKVLEVADDETRTGSLLGTPAYMAPEQAEGRLADIGSATDVYALGVVLYELLAGCPPFRGQSDVQTLQQVSQGDLPRPSRLRRGLSGDLEAIVLKCLERDTTRRYGSAIELANDLDRYLAGSPTVARPANPFEKTAKWIRRRPAIASLLMVVVLAAFLLAGGGWWYSGQLRVALAESRSHDLKARRLLHVASVNLAERALATNNVQQARDLLARDVPGNDEPDFRGFAWHHLQRRLHEEELTLRGHTGDVYCVRFAPNGRLLATASQDQTARVWDRFSGKCLSVLTGHTGDVNCVSFSTDSRLVASASDDGTVRIWDLATYEISRVLLAHEGGVFGVAFSPDGAKMATCGRDHNVRLWTTSNWQQVALLEGHTADVGAVVFSRQGDILVTASNDQTVRVWDVPTGQPKLTHGSFQSAVSSIALSRDGQQIVSAGRGDHKVRVWKTVTGVDLKVHDGFLEWIHTATFLNQDREIAVGAKDGGVAIIDARTSEVVRRLSGHAERVWNVSLSPDEGQLATASADRTVKIWNLFAGVSHEKLSSPSATFPRLALSRDGEFLATGGGNGRITVWNVESRRICWDDADLNNPTMGIRALAISPREELLAVSHNERAEVQVWDIRFRTRVGVLATQAAEIDALAFAPDGRTLAVGGSNGEVVFWDTTTKETLSHISLDGLRFMRMVYSPNGDQLAISGEDGAIKVWDVAGQRQLTTLHDDASYDVFSLSYSPDGTLIAAAGSSRVVNLWNVASEQKVATLTGHNREVRSVAFSPDGRCLASGGSDGCIKLWDLATKQEFYSLLDRFVCASAVAFHPDGRQLIAACEGPGGGFLHFWATLPPATATIDEPIRIGPEIRVNQTDDFSNSYPTGTLASNSNGSFVVAWNTAEDRNRSVRGRCFDAQGLAKQDEFIAAHEINNLPTVAMNARQQFVATWSVRDGNSRSTIVAQRFDAAGNRQGPEILVTTHNPDGPRRWDGTSSVGIDDKGGFVIGFDTHYDKRYHDYLRRYDREGIPLGDEARVSTDSIGDHHYNRLAMRPDGAFVFIWSHRISEKEPYFILARRYSAAGQPLDEHEVRVSPPGMAGQQMFPSVAIQADGGFIATWTSLDQFVPACGDVYLRRFDSQVRPIGMASKINLLVPGRKARQSSVAVTSQGEVIACWTNDGFDPDGSSGVFARRFNAGGVAVGAEFRVPTDFEGDQFGACVAATASDEFSIAWCDNAADHKGVFVQRFRSSRPISVPRSNR